MRLVPLTAVLLIAVGGGCAAPISYHPGDKPQVCRVHCGGQYNLYERGGEKPRYACILRAGEPLGFERDCHGRLVGLAEGDRFALAEREYRWVRVSQPALFECPADPIRFADTYDFVFQDILTPAFVVIGYIHCVPGVRP